MTHTVNEIRLAFLDFFKSKGHEIIPSASLIPHSDPSLMFVNAGMIPFKNVFSAQEQLSDKSGNPIKTACSSQKCVRAGGKHNDLDNVGYTARHHTFFEMLGNFSFGDYFKQEAIEYAWEFLTKRLNIPAERLYVTVYHTDNQAFNIWKEVTGLSDERIIRIDTSDNFWTMGDTGPCGPCSEIFYDHGEEYEGGLPGTLQEDGDRYIEIWNLVFMQYENLADGSQIDLPKPCIDTGMGLERISAVMQHVNDNYDIDLFAKLIASSKEISGNDAPEFHNSHRIIADHLRTSAFLIADGVLPSNEGRGYVLRRIMRRAMRHAHILGCKQPLMYKLVATLIAEMGAHFPELKRADSLIIETLKSEEMKFKETLGRGLKLLESESESLKKGDQLSGEIAFKLYDTYGFPLDLTQDILRSKEINVDLSGFDEHMEAQKTQARASWSGSGEVATSEIWFEIEKKHGATEFTGYSELESSATIIAIVKNGQLIEKSGTGEALIITDKTPFYAESGGQAGDMGLLKINDIEISVKDTKKQLGKLHIHVAEINNGSVTISDIVTLEVDKERRDGLRANHSATHILHAALRKTLGDHVTQKGSLVESDYFRFDFSNNNGLEAKDIADIERQVNYIIRQNTQVSTKSMSPDEAIEQGAMALFGEKYGDEVRVVTMGNQGDKSYSVELCGGIHVERTGDIGLFKITKESAVASGVRRIEGVCAAAALKLICGQEAILNEVSFKLKSTSTELSSRLTVILDERKKMEREIADLRKKIAMGGGNKSSSSADEIQKIADISFVAKTLKDIAAKDLRAIIDEYKKKITSGIIAIIAENEGKIAIVVGVTEDLTDRFNAVDLVRIGSKELGGKGGGGRRDFAQAGGVDISAAQKALEQISQEIGK